jgi:hypothetical protein
MLLNSLDYMPNLKALITGTGEKEFYDLVLDPHELENQASRLDPAFQIQLAAAVQAFATCAGNELYI